MDKTYYSWREGSRFKVTADIAANEFEKCADESGYIIPQLIVDCALSNDNPLHDEFEWNDAVAVAKYRRATARLMADSLIKTVEHDDILMHYHRPRIKHQE